MNLTQALEKRYSTKSFDATKKIPDDVWSQIEDSLRLAPSSTNVQPWHFIIASTEEGKKRITKGTEEPFHFNTSKILDASHVVLFCTKTTVDEAYLQHVLEKEDADGRYKDDEVKQMMHGGRSMFVNIHKDDLHDLLHWLEKQTYLNIGSALLGAGVLDIDALPMEGIDIGKLNEEFGLAEKGFTVTAAVAFGYRTEDDFNAKLPKSRLDAEEIFTKI